MEITHEMLDKTMAEVCVPFCRLIQSDQKYIVIATAVTPETANSRPIIAFNAELSKLNALEALAMTASICGIMYRLMEDIIERAVQECPPEDAEAARQSLSDTVGLMMEQVAVSDDGVEKQTLVQEIKKPTKPLSKAEQTTEHFTRQLIRMFSSLPRTRRFEIAQKLGLLEQGDVLDDAFDHRVFGSILVRAGAQRKAGKLWRAVTTALGKNNGCDPFGD